MSKITGSCFCKAISYEVSTPVIKSGVCHCNSCQKISGGSSWPFVVVEKEHLSIDGDIAWFARKGASGQEVRAGFCPHCSTTLFGDPDVWPMIVTVSASSLNNPELFVPEMHAWTEAKPGWVTLEDDLPHFEQNPTASPDC